MLNQKFSEEEIEMAAHFPGTFALLSIALLSGIINCTVEMQQHLNSTHYLGYIILCFF